MKHIIKIVIGILLMTMTFSVAGQEELSKANVYNQAQTWKTQRAQISPERTIRMLQNQIIDLRVERDEALKLYYLSKQAMKSGDIIDHDGHVTEAIVKERVRSLLQALQMISLIKESPTIITVIESDIKSELKALGYVVENTDARD